jgi:hypothetical protein
MTWYVRHNVSYARIYETGVEWFVRKKMAHTFSSIEMAAFAIDLAFKNGYDVKLVEVVSTRSK